MINLACFSPLEPCCHILFTFNEKKNSTFCICQTWSSISRRTMCTCWARMKAIFWSNGQESKSTVVFITRCGTGTLEYTFRTWPSWRWLARFVAISPALRLIWGIGSWGCANNSDLLSVTYQRSIPKGPFLGSDTPTFGDNISVRCRTDTQLVGTYFNYWLEYGKVATASGQRTGSQIKGAFSDLMDSKFFHKDASRHKRDRSKVWPREDVRGTDSIQT